jgi:putative transcriptional regulator
MEFFEYRNKIDLQKGRLLLSEPYLADPNFERTVILLTEHNEDGSVGFILNKPSESQVSEVMEDLRGLDAPIFIGGPVQQDTMHFIHVYPDLEDAIELEQGLYWGGNFDQLLIKVETGEFTLAGIKFFLGYSGWSPDQLQEELKLNSWIVSDRISHELIFETLPDQMWKRAMQELGGRFTVYSNYPADPRMN